MKTFLVHYTATSRKRTKRWSCTIQAKTHNEARKTISQKGSKVLKVELLS